MLQNDVLPEKFWKKHADLRAYLEGDISDSSVDLSLSNKYSKTIVAGFFHTTGLSLLDLLSLFGKTAHLNAFSATEIQTALKVSHYSPIRWAAYHGHTSTLELLMSHLTPDEKVEALKALNFAAIQWASQQGHIEALTYLCSHLTKEKNKEAVLADSYNAIQNAAREGHTKSIQYLDSYLDKKEKSDVAESEGYLIIRTAAANGYSDMLQYLLTHLSDAKKKDAVTFRH